MVNYIFIFLCLLLCFSLFVLLKKKEMIKLRKHPYSMRTDFGIVFDYVRVSFLFVMTTYAFLFIQIRIGLLSLGLLIAFSFVLYIKNNQKLKEQKYEEWEINKKEWLKIKEKYDKIKKTDKKGIYFLKGKRKIVVTDQAVYFGNKRFVSFLPRPLDRFKLTDIRIKDSFLICVFSFSGVPMKYYCFYIPKEKEEIMNDIIKKINRKIIGGE